MVVAVPPTITITVSAPAPNVNLMCTVTKKMFLGLSFFRKSAQYETKAVQVIPPRGNFDDIFLRNAVTAPPRDMI
jgi:hypothetical protein